MSETDNPTDNPHAPQPDEAPAAGGPEEETGEENGTPPQEPEGPRERRRRPPVARVGTASGIYALVIVAALVVANALGARTNRRLDLTANHRYTLHAGTLKILRELKQPITIYGFVQSGSSLGTQLQSLLKEYSAAAPAEVRTRVVDPASSPAEARQYGVRQYNEVVVVAGNSHATATPAAMYAYAPSGQAQFNGEQAVTNAILRAANPQHLTVYFLQGEGERQTQQTYSTVDQALTAQGYTVQTLNLIRQGSVPAGAAAVIVAGPSHDLAPAVAQALDKYASAGGHLMVLLDPTRTPQTRLFGLLAKLGVQARDDLVVDPAPQHHFQANVAAVVPSIQSHTITDPLTQGHLAVLMPASVSLSPVKGDKGVTATSLLKTSSAAYAKTNFSSPQVAFNAKTDIRGPFDLGIAVASAKKGGFRAVVLGSASFAADNTIGIQGNRDLFLNSVGWLTGRTQGITIQPTAALRDQIFLTGSGMRGLFYGFVFILPALSLAAAAVVWSWRRRL